MFSKKALRIISGIVVLAFIGFLIFDYYQAPEKSAIAKLMPHSQK